MQQKIIEKLLNEDEKVWLEFKSSWYWDNEQKELSKSWGEFLKDFSALFNSNSKDETKYLIIGFDEAKKQLKEFSTDKNGQKLIFIENLEDFKETIVSRLRRNFKNIPEYKNSNNLVEVENFFDIALIPIQGHTLLVFIFHPAPYLLELKRLLQGNQSFREGNIIIRKLKQDGTPENNNANSQEIDSLKKIVKLRQEKDYPNKDSSIKKIVEVFKEKYSPASEILEVGVERNYTSGIYFEIFTVQGEYFSAITFIYFSKYTSQNKTVEHIYKNSLLKDSGNTIIMLTDKLNKSHGNIDHERIKQLFYDKGYKIDINYLDDYALEKLYKDLFDPKIFHQGNFNITDFVRPYTSESDEKTVDLLLWEWYESTRRPLIVITGMGGIGKTTVIKYFLDELYSKTENANILFINSHEIINDIMKSARIESIYDFYKIVVQKNEGTKIFDEKLLELSIDHGKLIIILDGIDEVIAKVGVKFNITEFIDSIFKNYSENFEKTKVLITCRDNFWYDSTQKYSNIDKISLKPFSKNLALKYFRKHFNDESKINKAILLANNFASSNNEEIYIPYILDMIKDDLLSVTEIGNSEIRNINSKILKVEEINDFLVGKVCEREVIKLENFEIDRQIDFFVLMATIYNGSILDSHLKSLLSKLGIQKLNDIQIEKFKDHPILVFNKESGVLSFRFDFFNEYFRIIGLSIFIIKQEFHKIDSEMIDIISQYIGYQNSFTSVIKKRLSGDISEKIKYSIFCFLNDDIDKIDISQEKKNRLNSSLFILSMILTDVNNTEQRTSLLKEFYESKQGEIKNLCIINLHTIDGKVVFDFRGLKFDNCIFENYEHFSACKFDSKTYFTRTKFVAPLHTQGSKSKITEENIDTSSCELDGIIDVINEAKQVYENEEVSLRKNLKQIIKFFWQSSSFKQKLASETRKKLRNHSNILESLIRKGIIKTTTVTTKQKRVDKLYYIDDLHYSNLRKVMEENETCLEFEKIINLLQQDS